MAPGTTSGIETDQGSERNALLGFKWSQRKSGAKDEDFNKQKKKKEMKKKNNERENQQRKDTQPPSLLSLLGA